MRERKRDREMCVCFVCPYTHVAVANATLLVCVCVCTHLYIMLIQIDFLAPVWFFHFISATTSSSVAALSFVAMLNIVTIRMHVANDGFFDAQQTLDRFFGFRLQAIVCRLARNSARISICTATKSIQHETGTVQTKQIEYWMTLIFWRVYGNYIRHRFNHTHTKNIASYYGIIQIIQQ